MLTIKGLVQSMRRSTVFPAVCPEKRGRITVHGFFIMAEVSGCRFWILSGRKSWSGFPEIFADIISRGKFHERKDISFMRWQIMPEL